MMYKHLLRDFADRTFKNLQLLENHYGPDDRYEVTQLVNSLLGLIVFPKEKALGYIPETPFAQLKQDGWELFDIKVDNTGCVNLRGLISNLRHGTAHGKINFEDNGGKIEWLTFVNLYNGKHWEGRISAANLRKFIERFATLLMDEKTFPKNL